MAMTTILISVLADGSPWIGLLVWNSLAEQGKSPQAVQEVSAATLVEVQSRQRCGRVLQPEKQEGPAFFPHCDGPEFTDTEGQRPPAPFVAVVQRAWQTGDRDKKTVHQVLQLKEPPHEKNVLSPWFCLVGHKMSCQGGQTWSPVDILTY